jgi:hypothetical protein
MADAETSEPFRLDPAATEKWRSGADSSPDIASLTGSDDKSMAGLVSSLTDVQRKKTAADTKISAESDEQQTRDRAVRNHAFQLEGVSAAEMPKPWDANKEHKKWETDPIEGFGSMGGLFAMVASAFTHAPMENAINGLAGAINSTKEGNEAGYQRAYDAFKENVKLADQRFKMQHELYGDALSLGTADAAASAAKLNNAAVRFGDQQTLMLAEHGMIKEIYELQASRAAANEQMVKAADAIDLHTVQKAAVNAVKANPPNTGNPVQDKMMLAAQVQRIYDANGQYGSAEQEAVGRFMQANMQKSPQEIVDGLAKIHEQFVAKAPNIEGYRQAVAQEEEASGGEPLRPDRLAQLQQMFGLTPRPTGAGGTGGVPGMGKEQALAVEEELKKNPGLSRTEAMAKVKRETTTPSGNRMDDLSSKIDQTDNIIRGSQKQLDFLHTFKGGAGLMGKIMRGEEIASNIVGAGTQSERVEFRRRVHELQEMVPRIITDASGRPLKSAQDKVDDFVAGLNAGDTGPNTIRAYEDLITEMQKRQADYRARRQGGFDPNASSSGAAALAAPAKTEGDKRPLWESSPVKSGDKHSSADDAPPVRGARKAPDGNWYLSDPKRPGKYLQVGVG